MQTLLAILIAIVISSSIAIVFIFYQRPKIEIYKEGGQHLDSKIIEKAVNSFYKEYQTKLITKVNPNFRTHFYHHLDNYKVKAIISSNQILINIIKDLKNISYKVYLTNLNPQLKLHNVVHERNFTDSSYRFTHPDMLNSHAFDLSQKGMSSFHSGGTGALDGWLIPFNLAKDASILITGQNWKFQAVIDNKLIEFNTELPGSTIIIGTDNPEEVVDYLKEAALNLFNFELQTVFINSEPFRKSLAHPVLKTIATEIKTKQAKAENKVREYPFWEFEADMEELRSLARKHNIDDEYVNAVINDNQYRPVSGTLIKYYEGPRQFMMQWILINSLLLLISVSIVIFIPDRNHILYSAVAALFTIANAFIFTKIPSPMHMGWWITPFIVLIIAYIVLFFDSIFKSTN